MEDEALDSRGRNITLAVFGTIVVLIAALVIYNYTVKQDRIAGMRSHDPAREAAKVKEMMRGFTNEGYVAEQLQGERPSVRMAAVRALLALKDDADTKTREDAAKLTIPFLKDSDQPIKDQAVQSLTKMGPEISLKAVVDALGDSDGSVKGGAQTVCQNLAPDSIPAILVFSGKNGGSAPLRNGQRGNGGNALYEVSKRNDAHINTVILFGEEAIRARERGLTQEQAHAELQQYLKIQHPLQIAADAPVYGVVDYLQPQNGTEEDQNNAISILDRMGDKRAVPFLIPKLDQPTTRRAAVGALGRMGDKRATMRLVHYLPRDETNRLEIVIALGKIADPRSTKALIRYGLGSVSEPVRAAAADSLRNIGAPAVAPLIAAATTRDPKDPMFYRAAGATLALAGMRMPEATKVAVTNLRHPAENVREAAAMGLGESGDPSVIQPLIGRFFDPNGRVSGFAARSLSAFGAQAVPPLVAALSRPDEVYWASLAIRYIGEPAVPPLTDQLLHGDHAAAVAAAGLLGDLGDPQALTALKTAAESSDPDVQFAANSSIQRLGGA